MWCGVVWGAHFLISEVVWCCVPVVVMLCGVVIAFFINNVVLCCVGCAFFISNVLLCCVV
jgi:hypothetical protein